DHGIIAAQGSAAEVVDRQQPVPGLYVHDVKVIEGGFEAGLTVRVEVNEDRRTGAMRHHTGTHILHAALRETLGSHVKQAGSLVAPDRLRFDYTHFAPLTDREVQEIEEKINRVVFRNLPVQTKVMALNDAIATGAMAFFG